MIFVNARIKATAECIPTKLRGKLRVPWETLAVKKKRAHMKTNINAQKLNKVQNELTHT